jgi:hypothetical protein
MEDYLVIDDVVIPIQLNDKFILPDLEKALKYYPNFISHSKLGWSIQAYLCQIMKEIDKRKPNGYNGDMAVQEFISYFGLWEFGKLLMDKGE